MVMSLQKNTYFVASEDHRNRDYHGGERTDAQPNLPGQLGAVCVACPEVLGDPYTRGGHHSPHD